METFITIWQAIAPYAAVYGAAVAFCTAVVKATPSTKDDEIWGKIVKVLDFFSTAFTKSDKLLLVKGAEKLAEEAKKNK
jgi:hypothetical protein